MTISTEQVLLFADFHEQYSGRYIGLADTKASVVLAFVGALLSYLARSAAIPDAINPISPALPILVTVSAGLLVASFAYAFLVIWPRGTRSGKDLIYWKGVAEFATAREYVQALDALDEQHLADHRLVHIYDLSRVCRAKYERLSWSLAFAAAGIILCAITLALHQIYYG